MYFIAKLISVITFCALVAACQPESSISEDLELNALDCKIQIPDGYRLTNSNGFIHGTLWHHDPGLPNIFQYDPDHSMKDKASKNNIYFRILSEEQLGSLSFLKVALEPEDNSRSTVDVITNDSEFFLASEVTESIFLDQFKECVGKLANKSLNTDTGDAGAG